MFLCVIAEISKRQKSTGGEYQNVPFSYGTEETSRDGRKSEDAMESSEFKPQFPVPDNFLSHLVSVEAPFKLNLMCYCLEPEVRYMSCSWIFDSHSLEAFCLDDMAHTMPVIF